MHICDILTSINFVTVLIFIRWRHTVCILKYQSTFIILKGNLNVRFKSRKYAPSGYFIALYFHNSEHKLD